MILRISLPIVEWMGIISYIGLTIALWDLYKDIEEDYCCYEKPFYIFRGIYILIFLISAVLGVLLFVKILKITSKISDLFTLLTLLISLPRKLVCTTIGKLIVGEKEYE